MALETNKLSGQDFQTRLLVWAARILRTAAEVEDNPEQAITLVDMARRLEDMAHRKLLESLIRPDRQGYPDDSEH